MNMKKQNKLLILIGFLLIVITSIQIPVHAVSNQAVNDYDLTLYSVDNGIPTGEANAVLQTSDGYIWIGGYGGLQRYDGVEFSLISGEQSGLTSFSIRSLWESKDGVLWVGSNDQGPFYLDGQKFVRVSGTEDTAFQSVRCFAQGVGDEIWMGTSEGIAILKDGKVHPWSLNQFGKQNCVTYALSNGEDGLIWGINSNGILLGIHPYSHELLYCYEPGELWSTECHPLTMTPLSDGSIAIGMKEKGVYLIQNPSSGKPKCKKIDTQNLYAIRNIFQSANGDIWCCGDQGLGIIDKTGNHFTDLSNYPYTNHLVCIEQDYEKGIWAASSRHGVLHLTRSKIGWLPLPNHTDAVTYTIEQDKAHTYLATEAGLMVLDKNWNPIDNEAVRRLGHTPLRHIAIDQKGQIWLSGYYEGLYIYCPKDDSLRKIDVNNSRVRMVLPLADGTIAVAHYGGLFILKDGKIVQSYEQKLILCLEELSNGTLLCGTDGNGIYSLKDGVFEPYANVSSGLTSGVILRIASDQKKPRQDLGFLWL